MASYSSTRSKHATLAPATVDTVVLSFNFAFVEVVNRATAGAGIFFTTDGTDPTVSGDNTYWVGPDDALIVRAGAADTVKLISATADSYTVTGVEE